MLDILLLLTFGKLQEFVYEETSSAWHWALAYAAAVFLLSVFGGDLLGALLSALIMGVYAWGYFALLRVVVDNILLWILVFIGGALLPWLLLFKLVAMLGAAAA